MEVGDAFHTGVLDGSLRPYTAGGCSLRQRAPFYTLSGRAMPLLVQKGRSPVLFAPVEAAHAPLLCRPCQGFSSISVDAAEYYNCSQITINTLVTVGNFAQIFVALIWTMNLESTYGLQIPYVVGVLLLFVGGWLSYIGAVSLAPCPPPFHELRTGL